MNVNVQCVCSTAPAPWSDSGCDGGFHDQQICGGRFYWTEECVRQDDGVDVGRWPQQQVRAHLCPLSQPQRHGSQGGVRVHWSVKHPLLPLTLHILFENSEYQESV